MLPFRADVPLDNTVEIEAPEHVRFRYRVAGPVRRGLAYLIDLAIRVAILGVLMLVIGLATGKDAGALTGVLLVAAFLLEWGYYVFVETTGEGRSPGKRALSLRVVREGGFPIGFTASVLRNLLRGADFLPIGYVLGLLAMAGDARFRRLGDRVAGTMVIIEERTRVGAPLALWPAANPEELSALPARPRLSAGERETLEMFLRRADLTEARREELANIIAPALARRLGVTTSFSSPVRFLALVHHRATAAVAPARGD